MAKAILAYEKEDHESRRRHYGNVRRLVLRRVEDKMPIGGIEKVQEKETGWRAYVFTSESAEYVGSHEHLGTIEKTLRLRCKARGLL